MTQLFFRIAHVSKDGRDLAILASRDRLLLVRDFERVCREEISLANAGQVLRLLPGDRCFYLAFGHGRVCVATVRFSTHVPTLLVPTDGLPLFLCFPFSLSQLHGLYIVNLGRDPSIYLAKVVFVRPHFTSASGRHQPISCMQLTDCRIYFSWEDARRRDIPLFKDGENMHKASSTGTQSTAEPSPEVWPWLDPKFGGNIPSLML